MSRRPQACSSQAALEGEVLLNKGPPGVTGWSAASDVLSLFPLGSTLRRQKRPRRSGSCETHGFARHRAADQGDAGGAERSALRPLELDPRPLVVEDGAQLRILRSCQIALRLQDEEVGRQAHLELALLGLELFLGKLPRRGRGLDRVPTDAMRLHM